MCWPPRFQVRYCATTLSPTPCRPCFKARVFNLASLYTDALDLSPAAAWAGGGGGLAQRGAARGCGAVRLARGTAALRATGFNTSAARHGRR